MAIEVFNRVEKKYIIDDYSYHVLNEKLSAYMIEDSFCTGNRFYSISNIYFDTWDDELIRCSIDRPIYKEKLRLRSYGIPTREDKVFLEIKKKFKGVVNKRRTVLQLSEAYDFLLDNKFPMPNSYINEQVLNELKYFMELYKPVPKVYLAYDRKALFGKEDGELRITFDTNIRTRRERLRLESGDDGEKLLQKGTWLMEIKTVGSMPVWLSELLTELKIYGCSFSKYGTEYKNYIAAKRSGTERKNMLDTIFETSEGSATLSIVPTDALICIGVALVLGLIISMIYIFTNRRKRFSTNFAITLVILPAMVSIVIILVGSDIARAFSIAGVFTLVRFRSLPGDSKDISHVLFAMAIGLASGMGYIVFAAVATVIIGVVYFILMMTNYGVIRNVEKTLRITIPENLNYQGAFDDLFQEFTDKIYLDKVRTTNMGSMYELTYQLIFKKDADEKKFIDELRCRNGNLSILLCRAEVVEML